MLTSSIRRKLLVLGILGSYCSNGSSKSSIMPHSPGVDILTFGTLTSWIPSSPSPLYHKGSLMHLSENIEALTAEEAVSMQTKAMERAFIVFLHNVEAWHPLAGAPFRFWLRLVATLRLGLGPGSGLSSAALLAILVSCDWETARTKH